MEGSRLQLSRFLPWSPKANGAAVATPEPNHQATEKKSDIEFFGDLSAGRIVYVGGSPGEVEAVQRNTAYAAALYAYVAIRYRSENVAEPPLRVVERTDDGDEFVDDHPLAEILEEPSLDYDMGELLELTQTYWDIGGDALWAKDANLAGLTGRLQPFQADEYSVRPTRERILGRFIVKTSRGEKPFDAEEVVYFRYANPGSRTRGLSPVDVALSWLNLGQRTSATIRGLLKNAIFPSVVISPHQEWAPDDQEYERFKAQIEAYHSGPANTGKPFVALGGSKVSRVAFTLQELLPEELLNRVEANVAAAFRIPPIVLGYLVGLENSPWSQMEQAHRQAYSDAIQPLWRRYEKALTRQLLRPVDPDPRRRLVFDTSEVAALQDDESQKITDAATATYWTLNQRLVHSGQDPLPDDDERGDWIEAMTSTVPVVTPTESIDDEAGKAATKAAGQDRDWKWSLFDLMAKAQESAWAAECSKQLREDLGVIIEATESDEFGAAWEAALEKELPRSLDELDVETKMPPLIITLIGLITKGLDLPARWRERTEPLVESTARTALKEVSAELGIAFDVIEPSLLDYTRDEVGWLVTKITSTTREKLASEMAAGLEAGDTISDLRKRLEKAHAFSRERAELIARSETTRATNGSQRKALSDYQVADPTQVVQKSWLSSRDARVRAEHKELDRDGAEEGWIGIDDAYANGLTEPGEPNCRCTNLYRIREA